MGAVLGHHLPELSVELLPGPQQLQGVVNSKVWNPFALAESVTISFERVDVGLKVNIGLVGRRAAPILVHCDRLRIDRSDPQAVQVLRLSDRHLLGQRGTWDCGVEKKQESEWHAGGR